MAKIDTLEMTKREQANILSILDMLTRARVQTTDGRIWLDERETKEIMSRVDAAYKTMFQEEQEWE